MVVLDGEGRVLLLKVHDPSGTEPPFWITPGGGIEAGEEAAEAAARELREESGLEVAPSALGHVVATSRGEWEFEGEPLYTESVHFHVRTAAFAIDETRWSDEERRYVLEWRWWTPEEVERSDEIVFPPLLSALARRLHRGDVPEVPVQLPWSH